MSERRPSVQDGYVKTALRLPKELHGQVHAAAEAAGKSFNAELIARIRGDAPLAAGGLSDDTIDRIAEAVQERIHEAERPVRLAFVDLLKNIVGVLELGRPRYG